MDYRPSAIARSIAGTSPLSGTLRFRLFPSSASSVRTKVCPFRNAASSIPRGHHQRRRIDLQCHAALQGQAKGQNGNTIQLVRRRLLEFNRQDALLGAFVVLLLHDRALPLGGRWPFRVLRRHLAANHPPGIIGFLDVRWHCWHRRCLLRLDGLRASDLHQAVIADEHDDGEPNPRRNCPGDPRCTIRPDPVQPIHPAEGAIVRHGQNPTFTPPLTVSALVWSSAAVPVTVP
jgi:hypothetical protein